MILLVYNIVFFAMYFAVIGDCFFNLLLLLFYMFFKIFYFTTMEIIRIPQVSLVDLTGRKIGVYSEDPDWWQQLKIKQRNKTHLAINSSQHLESEHDRRTSPEGIEMRNQSAGSQVRLIEDDSNSKLAKTSVFDDSSLDKENDFGNKYFSNTEFYSQKMTIFYFN